MVPLWVRYTAKLNQASKAHCRAIPELWATDQSDCNAQVLCNVCKGSARSLETYKPIGPLCGHEHCFGVETRTLRFSMAFRCLFETCRA